MGVPTKLISEHLGHADTRTTEQVYSHIFAATRSKASDAISLALK
jgi:integrase